MTDAYAADNPDWRDCPGLPGWQIMTRTFDYDRFVGVAIKHGELRHAIRAPQGVTDPDDAIKRSLPTLKQWAEAQR